MTSLTKSSQTFHHPRLLAFAKRFEQAHVDLACHAAFPLALTPELLYCLRENFLPRAPWIAVADILLFLCEPVGFQLYELEGEVRNELLVHLKNNFHEKRLYELSDFMVAYIRQQLKTNDRASQDLGAAPQWTALAYIKPQQAVDDIAQALKKALEQENPAEWVQLTSLIESYADINPLFDSGFEPLLVLSRGWDAKARGEEEEAAAEFEKLRQEYGEEIEVGEVRFEIPSADNDDELLSFEFEVVTVNRRGEIIERETKQARYFTEDLDKGITLEMVAIPGGKFMMGSPEGEGDESEKPQHEVSVQPFFMGKYPITQAQWRAVAALPQVNRELKPDPSHFKGDDRPVECVSWYDAVEFCDRLSNKTGKSYRLPSEAEWEYACRSGTTSPFHFGETITDKLANYNANYTFADEPKGNSRNETTPVGTFSPNAFGLYDMHGNLWEWCGDNWHGNYQGVPTYGSAWADKNSQKMNDNHMLRGGSWYYNPVYCRSAYRGNSVAGGWFDNSAGFRIACTTT
jgi:formylglycine-generating enzyme required for sulfatase activity